MGKFLKGKQKYERRPLLISRHKSFIKKNKRAKSMFKKSYIPFCFIAFFKNIFVFFVVKGFKKLFF